MLRGITTLALLFLNLILWGTPILVVGIVKFIVHMTAPRSQLRTRVIMILSSVAERWAGGNDRIFGMAGRDHLSGNDGEDRIDGGSGSDTIWGSGGSDTLFGRGGADQLHGEAGDDHILGGRDDDSIWGDDGTDRARGGPGRDASNCIERPHDKIELTLPDPSGMTTCV